MEAINIIRSLLSAAKNELEVKNTFFLRDVPYGLREIYEEPKAFDEDSEFSGDYSAFGEDDCGNFFLINEVNGAILFWDHETDETTALAVSLKVFLEALRELPPVHLKPGQVKSAWVDPDFLASLKKEKKKS